MTTKQAIHNFHIPVMGVAFTIDSPIKVAHYGISSVVSMVDDGLMEQLRAYYCEQFNLAYEEISAKVEDFRAKRITAYLDMMQDIVKMKFEELKSAAWEKGSELEKYIHMLPDFSTIKKDFLARVNSTGMNSDLRDWLNKHLSTGSIDVNIMTKLDKENVQAGEKLPSIFNDAHAALRGFANSKLNSSVVLSAGLNPRLYSYFEQFKDFFPNANGEFAKKIILKISDYRSALIQGKFLAKKGLWVSEFRLESGLNCGGHAFATDGELMGPILAEFKERKQELSTELFGVYAAALEAKNIAVPSQILDQTLTAQGGIGTADEQNLLMDYYQLSSVGWGSTFLLVPDATTVDDATLKQLCEAKEKDLYLSHNSPLGVRFNNIRNNTMADEKQFLIQKNRPGSPCPKKYSALNKDYTEDPICTASRQYQHLKIQDLKSRGLSDLDFQKHMDFATTRECLCVGLTNSALMKYNIPTTHYKESVSICPGPNLAYYDQVLSLEQMVDHIYGRANYLNREDRPHAFVKELELYVQFFEEAVIDLDQPKTKQRLTFLASFENNLQKGINYYENLFEELNFSEQDRNQLDKLKDRLNQFVSREMAPVILA
ncbi:MAG: hypothetical protein K9I36_16520 [Bacteroidia bacterium]|nr:hypothetical protein [Bacteroidia bacterium]